MERTGIFYLNNRGDRWVVLKKGKKPKIEIQPDTYSEFDHPIIRTAICFENFGNFASARFWYKGELQSSLNYKLIEPDN
jgi:hypothetical protein